MRLASLACALAITLGCGGKAQPASDSDEDTRGGPFVNKGGFEPTAFTVEVRGREHLDEVFAALRDKGFVVGPA